LHSRSRTEVLDRLLTVEEAADRLGTSVRFVRRLIAERRIAYVKVGRHVRLDPADVEAFIAASRVQVRPSLVAALPQRPSSRHASPAPRRRVS
jgi:excisionase family DNA binding protein